MMAHHKGLGREPRRKGLKPFMTQKERRRMIKNDPVKSMDKEFKTKTPKYKYQPHFREKITAKTSILIPRQK
jgi:hypothetical protein